jgi:hypothetical protein
MGVVPMGIAGGRHDRCAAGLACGRQCKLHVCIWSTPLAISTRLVYVPKPACTRNEDLKQARICRRQEQPAFIHPIHPNAQAKVVRAANRVCHPICQAC